MTQENLKVVDAEKELKEITVSKEIALEIRSIALELENIQLKSEKLLSIRNEMDLAKQKLWVDELTKAGVAEPQLKDYRFDYQNRKFFLPE